MIPGPARLSARPRLLVAALTSRGLLLGIGGTGAFATAARAAATMHPVAAPAATMHPARTPDPAHPLTVTITALSPVSLSPGSTLLVDAGEAA